MMAKIEIKYQDKHKFQIVIPKMNFWERIHSIKIQPMKHP